MTNDKNALLKEVLQALQNDNNTVMVETVDGRPNRQNIGTWSHVAGADNTSIPLPRDVGASGNRMHAHSIKIGPDIVLRKLDNSSYMVRTANGSGTFNVIEGQQVDLIWSAALKKYENGPDSDFMSSVRKYMHDAELRAIADGPRIPMDKISKFQRAQQQLQGLGVESEVFAQYVAQSKQND